MTSLTKKAKVALGCAGAGVLALAVGLGIWQPWVKPEQPEEPSSGVQGEVLPPAENKEDKLTLSVGGEKIPCTIFEGDGWQIYVPEGWQAEKTVDHVAIQKDSDVYMTVIGPLEDAYAGGFVHIYPIHTSEGRIISRQFYADDGENVWRVDCNAPEDAWNDSQKLMTAMVRTMTVGGEKIFSGLSPVASEPDWQIIDGDTLLWMDKDAYVVDDALKAQVEGEMMAWDKEMKVNFTGQYRIDELTWAGSYTCVEGRAYVDVFCSQVWFEIVEGKEEAITDWLTPDNDGTFVEAGGVYFVDGWLHGDAVYTVLFHDGSAVEEVRVISQAELDDSDLIAELMKD